MSRAPQLVRARPKAVEYLPEWALCCPAQRGKYEAEVNTVLTLDMSTSRLSKSTCPDCGKDTGKLKFATVLNPYLGPIAIDLLDIDEGPVIHE